MQVGDVGWSDLGEARREYCRHSRRSEFKLKGRCQRVNKWDIGLGYA